MVHLKAFKITALCTATQLILMALAICKRRNCEPAKIFPYVTNPNNCKLGQYEYIQVLTGKKTYENNENIVSYEKLR